MRKVQDKVKEIRSATPEPAKRFNHKRLPEKSSVTAAPLAEAIGAKATEKDGMVKFTIGRTTTLCAVRSPQL